MRLAQPIETKWRIWLRGVDLNHRPLGYECNHQQNLKTMRGAKSNALFLTRADCNQDCPCVALVIQGTCWTTFPFRCPLCL
jgi:hypothetical protein